MQIKTREILAKIKELRREIDAKLKAAQEKSAVVQKKKRQLAAAELKLRSMRAAAVEIRAGKLSTEKEKELKEYFDYLKAELDDLGVKI
ncbi:Atg14 domain-containing protein [Halanaerobium sp. Z-7514]|uniref:Atg14 domain-containing protein n=1 Tax=Halanaerobium polyolivorans TaxID=2886943 RepID=A0AAW4WVN3_9FIRM|nr:Atg14 domain-containing protein [Halanaerobium polyolivorans]MCC3145167.1 Atg14 domain-containing protein [Halanaerobium polyolivorans]